MLSLGYSWALKGKPLQVRSRWASQGRINLIGAWLIHGQQSQLYYRQLQARCNAEQVKAFIDSLRLQQAQTRLVIVLDNAPFHKAHSLQQAIPLWSQQQLELFYLPSYCPKLNYIETIWRKLKGFLMPRRFYNSLDDLNAALLSALSALGAILI
jgi:putative transposase